MIKLLHKTELAVLPTVLVGDSGKPLVPAFLLVVSSFRMEFSSTCALTNTVRSTILTKAQITTIWKDAIIRIRQIVTVLKARANRGQSSEATMKARRFVTFVCSMSVYPFKGRDKQQRAKNYTVWNPISAISTVNRNIYLAVEQNVRRA